RRDAAARNDLARNILDGFALETRTTGFFCWRKLPEPWNSVDFADAARQRGVLVAEGEHFLSGHTVPEQGARLALGGVRTREELAAALEILADLLHERR
ncbi:MAG: PLP-dependent aminotransferase family protein, partial [Desulfovibrionaceae bacterium]|nr:PLP-dependent aminotransferase family protein [Desulfovibrionaceae bacterium]